LAAVGVNCTHPKFIGPLLQTLIDAQLESIPVVIYPNSGEDWDRSIGYATCRPLETIQFSS
jgi:S-methylmethionine-dependent homocysteine/selenocysteine methylase